MSEFIKWWREQDEDIKSNNNNNKISSNILKQLNLTSSASFLLSQTQSSIFSRINALKENAFVNIEDISTATTKQSTTATATAASTTTTDATETLSLTQLPQIKTATASIALETSNSISRILNSAITIINDTTINELEPNEEILYNDEDYNWISSGSLLLLIIIYGLVVFGGILGNASLFVTLCSQSSVRLRNPLLVALCLADLLVAGVSAPSTIVTLALTQKSWTLPSIGCKAIYYFQSMPVAASTISFLMLSLDRYATVKHPSLAQLRQRRYVHTMLATFSWIGACAICIPILLAYRITNTTISTTTASTSTSNAINTLTNTIASTSRILTRGDMGSIAAAAAATATSSTTTVHQTSNDALNSHQIMYTTCLPDYGSNELRTSFIIVHTVLVFIFPGLGVILNHYGVRRKLCALSLTARAAHGELPLPMPILRRPTHMIIVTGIANAARGVVNDDSSDDDDDDEQKHNVDGGGGDGVNGAGSRNVGKFVGGCGIEKNHNNVVETIIKASPKCPRAMREIRIQQQRQKLHNQGKTPAPELPLPQTSTLRARRRLANMLVAAAIIFIGCWTPHVFCVLWTEFNNQKQYCSKTISYFSLLLGYTHSAISPIMYWTLNHNTLRQSPCAPFIRFGAIQRFLRTRLRSPAAPPPPSSTNEAALGAFNPRYIKTTPKQYRAQASSHYLY